MNIDNFLDGHDQAWATLITDPGASGAIPTIESGACPIVTVAAETRTLEDPASVGQLLLIYFETDGGDCTITVDNGINVDGHTKILLQNAGEMILLLGTEVGSDLRWRVQSASRTAEPGTIDLPLLAFLNATGTESALVIFATGAYTIAGFSDANEGMVLRWNDHANPDPIKTTFVKPQDLDSTKDIVLHILAIRSGTDATDLVTFTVTAFDSVVGAALDADADFGVTSTAMINDVLVQELTSTLLAANISASNGAITLTIQPTDGLLDTIDVTVLGVWIEYTKKALTS